MTDETLWTRFEELQTPVEGIASAAIAVEATRSHLLIKNTDGEPVLLLRCEARRTPRAPIRLKHVSVAFDEVFEVTLQAGDPMTTGRYTKLVCSRESPSLHRWFVELIGAITQAAPGELSVHEVDELLASLLELFRQAAPPTTETVLGLWGELITLDGARDITAFARAWHNTPAESFDFDFGDVRLEVKTTLRPTREHEFSLNQAAGGRPGDYVLSIIARRTTGGQSVLDLARRIAAKLSGKGQERLWRIVMETLGPELDGVDEQCFDVVAAKKSVRLFQAGSIPAPIVELPNRAVVSNVRFCASLAHLGDGLPLALIGVG